MEDILSSIKRIIAEEGDAPAKPGRAARGESPPVEAADEILELDQPMDTGRAAEPVAQPETKPQPPVQPQPSPVEAVTPAQPASKPSAASPPQATTAPPAPDPIVSRQAAAAARGSLDSLSRLIVKPEPGSDGTLEGLVRELLRPMLTEWVDAHLPALVESMVEREIKRITAEYR